MVKGTRIFYNEKKIVSIVRRYRYWKKKNPDLHIDYCIKQRNLNDAIVVAAKSIDENNKVHSHQKRVGRERLRMFAETLSKIEPAILRTKSFDELHELIGSSDCYRIGALTIYDIANRIGHFRNIYPDKVYLHSGTRTGAKQLFGKLNGVKSVLMNNIPTPFITNNVSAIEMEDILCIYKDEMHECII